MPGVVVILEAVVAIVIAHYVFHYLTSPIKAFPGPSFAKFSNFWRFIDVVKGRSDITLLHLHRKYGNAVRVGPNFISLNDPTLIKTIYSTRDTWLKSDMYRVNDFIVGGQRLSSLFSTQDEAWHTAVTKPVSRLYAMSSVLQYEPLIDKQIDVFLAKLDQQFVSTNKPCQMDQWLHYWAWDVIGEITFSKDFGFMEQSKDVSRLIWTGEKAVDYFCAIGCLPILDNLFDKNPVYQIGPPSFSAAGAFTAQQIALRSSNDDKEGSARQKDMLDDFLEIKKSDDSITDIHIITWTQTNVVAGSDTTAIELRAVLYYLCKHPEAQRKLQAELDEADVRGRPASWKNIKDLPYLDAVIRESIRLHPAVGLPIERIVPEGGLKLDDGRYIPAGTIVGMNPWVVHKDVGVFGADPDSFRPERWLRQKGESQDAFEARVAKMRNTDLTFGFGKRICSGRFIALLETFKLMATLFSAYDMELADPSKDWKVRNSWFVRQSDMDVVLKRRN